jgi:hypothetical protein
MDDVAHVSAENAVELIFASHRITTVTAFAQAVKLAAIVPASGFLTNIAADGALVAKLRTRHLGRRLGQGMIAVPDKGALSDLCDGRKRADAKTPFRRLSDPAQCIEPADAHDLFDIEDIIPKASEEIRSPCVKPGSVGCELLHSLPYGTGANIREI